MTPVDFIGTVCLLGGVLFLLFAWKTRKESLTLNHFETFPDQELPGLSIVVAAKDEEKTIGPALDSLLALDYPNLEIILVDDRSTDQTYRIASERRQEHPRGERLKIVPCRELPEGWLGKMHALHLGAKMTTKPLILFTDADVVFQQGSLKRAVTAQMVLQCHHLAAAPRIRAKGFWEPVLVAFFLLMFTLRFRPNQVHKKKKHYVGVGAFNLIDREALEVCDFLEPLRLQVLDDVHLGRLVKSRDLSQYCLIAEDEISVQWFSGLRGCFQVLEKNAYAGLNYSLPFGLSAIFVVVTPFTLPFSLILLNLTGWALAYLLFLVLLGATIPEPCRLPRWVGFFFPLAAVVLSAVFLRSVILAEARRGIVWRDTHYPLDLLRREQHRFLKQVAPL